MKPSPRYLDPLALESLGATLVAALERIARPGGSFAQILAERPEGVVLVALGPAGALGAAIATKDGRSGGATAEGRIALSRVLLPGVVKVARERWPNWRPHGA